jgi:uncharacterized protein YndB with AHSA1/START domain
VSAQITLVVRRTIKASPARVYDAWTRPEHLLRWWGPRPVTCFEAQVDLRAGGEYRIGNRLPDGAALWIVGRFEIVETAQRLVYTWQVEGKESPRLEPSRVTVRFEARGQGTEVVVVHERIDTEATRDEHEHGWIGCLENLEALFASE